MIAPHGPARRAYELIVPTAASLGFEIVRVRFGAQTARTLQIMAERPDGSMSIGDCEELSHAVSALLDVEDPIQGQYTLEVSSPGMARPLTRPKDFERWAGFDAKIELTEMVDGRRRFRGQLMGFENGEVLIEISVEGEKEPVTIGLPLSLIDDAKLVMTDALMRAGASQPQ